MDGYFYDPKLYRRKGNLTLAQEGYRLLAKGCREKAKEAEGYFFKAIDIVRINNKRNLGNCVRLTASPAYGSRVRE